MIQVKFKATFINTEFKVIHEIHFYRIPIFLKVTILHMSQIVSPKGVSKSTNAISKSLAYKLSLDMF